MSFRHLFFHKAVQKLLTKFHCLQILCTRIESTSTKLGGIGSKWVAGGTVCQDGIEAGKSRHNNGALLGSFRKISGEEKGVILSVEM